MLELTRLFGVDLLRLLSKGGLVLWKGRRRQAEKEGSGKETSALTTQAQRTRPDTKLWRRRSSRAWKRRQQAKGTAAGERGEVGRQSTRQHQADDVSRLASRQRAAGTAPDRERE